MLLRFFVEPYTEDQNADETTLWSTFASFICLESLPDNQAFISLDIIKIEKPYPWTHFVYIERKYSLNFLVFFSVVFEPFKWKVLKI